MRGRCRWSSERYSTCVVGPGRGASRTEQLDTRRALSLFRMTTSGPGSFRRRMVGERGGCWLRLPAQSSPSLRMGRCETSVGLSRWSPHVFGSFIRRGRGGGLSRTPSACSVTGSASLEIRGSRATLVTPGRNELPFGETMRFRDVATSPRSEGDRSAQSVTPDEPALVHAAKRNIEPSHRRALPARSSR